MSKDQIRALINQGEEHGCVDLSRFSELVQEAELDDDELSALYEELDERGIELHDDCGREHKESTYVNGDLAVATTDALQLFLNEAARYPLLTAAEEVELAKRVERGDEEAKERMINSNLRLVVSIAKRYQGHGLSLLDLVDPPGRPTRRREQVADDPDPGAHRRAGAEDRPGGARARPGPRAAAD